MEIHIHITGEKPIILTSQELVEISKVTNANGKSFNPQKIINKLVDKINQTICEVKNKGI